MTSLHPSLHTFVGTPPHASMVPFVGLGTFLKNFLKLTVFLTRVYGIQTKT